MMEMEAMPQLLGGSLGLVPQLQQTVTSTEPAPINFDPWVNTGPSDQVDYNNELNQMAWTNWEAFIDDFQANGDYSPGQEGAIPPSYSMW